MTYGNGTFIVFGRLELDNETILTSADGITWTSRTSRTKDSLTGVTYGNGIFVAVCGGATILTSTDAITWTVRSSGTFTNTSLNGVTYGNGTFVAVGGSFIADSEDDSDIL